MLLYNISHSHRGFVGWKIRSYSYQRHSNLRCTQVSKLNLHLIWTRLIEITLSFALLYFLRISEISIESFIIRVYRQKNRTGFIKAFTDEPDQLSVGIAKTEKLLKMLYLRRLYLWPRFKLDVSRVLSISPPVVIELSQPLSPLMLSIQSAILVAMKGCVNEIKKSAPHIDSHFQLQLTLENAMFKSFDFNLRTHLESEWHRTGQKTKQLMNDVSQLRKLLEYLLRYDAYSFYSFLLSLKSSLATNQTSPSLWCVFNCI